MRVLMVHNYYQHRGGEDESTEQEIRLLQKHHHDVKLFSRHNDEINKYTALQKAGLFIEPTWSRTSHRQVIKEIRTFQPDIIHVQNFFPLISPAVFFAAERERVPVVYTLRNYRLLCPIGLFFRDGKVCEECHHYSLWSAVIHKCYHQSKIQSASAALLLASHRWLRTWQEKVSIYIALSDFSRQKFIEGGIDPLKIFVRPNYLESDPGIGINDRKFASFVGRLSPEKGLDVVLKAWEALPHIPLKIIGDGPLNNWIQDYIQTRSMSHVELMGHKSLGEVYSLLKESRFLVMSSKVYETFGRTIIEAFATATPVIASRLGAMADLVQEGDTGLLFTPNDAADLENKVAFADANPNLLSQWGKNARLKFETHYSETSAYQSILDLYRKAKMS